MCPRHGAIKAVPDPRISTSNGEHLYQLSDNVPYLLCPRQYLTGLDALVNEEVLVTISRDPHGKELFRQQKLDSRERALLIVLMLARTPVNQRSAKVQLQLSLFNLQNDKLLLYKHVDGGTGEMHLDLNQYCALLHNAPGLSTAPLLRDASEFAGPYTLRFAHHARLGAPYGPEHEIQRHTFEVMNRKPQTVTKEKSGFGRFRERVQQHRRWRGFKLLCAFFLVLSVIAAIVCMLYFRFGQKRKGFMDTD